MTRFASCLFAVMAMLFTALPTKAEAAGDYTAELQAFLTTLGPAERERFDDWWGRMPDYFKQSLFESKFENWREVIYCDYLGFRAGTPQSDACVAERTESWQQNASQWNADGSFRGPSEECVARGRTDQFGRLVCVDESVRKDVQDYWDSLPHEQKLKEFSRPGHFWEALQYCNEQEGLTVGTELYKQCEQAYANQNIPIN